MIYVGLNKAVKFIKDYKPPTILLEGRITRRLRLLISDELLGNEGISAHEFCAHQVEYRSFQVTELTPFEPSSAIDKVAMGQSTHELISPNKKSLRLDADDDDEALPSSETNSLIDASLIKLGIILDESKIELDYCSSKAKGYSVYEICREVDKTRP